MSCNCLFIDQRSTQLSDKRWQDQLYLIRYLLLLKSKNVFTWNSKRCKLSKVEFHTFQNRKLEFFVDMLNWHLRLEECLRHEAASDQASNVIQLVLATHAVKINLTNVLRDDMRRVVDAM